MTHAFLFVEILMFLLAETQLVLLSDSLVFLLAEDILCKSGCKKQFNQNTNPHLKIPVNYRSKLLHLPV